MSASGWAESEGGASSRVLWAAAGFCDVVGLEVALGISKSEVLSMVNEGAMIATVCGL